MGCFSMSRKPAAALLGLILIFTLSLYGEDDIAIRRQAADAISSHQFNRALQILESLLKVYPKDASLWTLRGLALDGTGQTKEGLASFDHALALERAYAPALEGASQIAYRHGDPHAMEYVQRLLAVMPGNEIANGMAAALAYQSHDCTSSIQYFEQSKDAAYQSPTALAEFADCLLKSDKALEAVAILSRGSQLHPESTQLKYNLAVAQMRAHDPNGAIATLAPLSNEKDSELLNLLASAYTRTNKPDDAYRILENAVEISPKDESNYLDLAILCLEHNQEGRAVTAATAGIARLPRAASLYLIRGVAYAQLAQYDKSESDFTTAAGLEPHQLHGTIAMSLLYSNKNDLGKEKDLLTSQLKAMPNDAIANYLLADLLIRSGAIPHQPEYEEAQAHLATSLAAKPDSVEALVLMGKLLEQQNDLLRALKHFQMAVKIDPENRSALNREFILLRKLHHDKEANEALNRLKSLLNNELKQEITPSQMRVD